MDETTASVIGNSTTAEAPTLAPEDRSPPNPPRVAQQGPGGTFDNPAPEAGASNERTIPDGDHYTKNASFRGPIRFELETSSATIEAGRMFTVFVRITNPYDVPVTITSVDTVLPFEFWDPYDTEARRGILHELKTIFENNLKDRTVRIYATPSAENAPSKAPISSEKHLSTGPSTTPPRPVLLQPGNSHLAEFSLRTRRKTFFSPSTYNLHFSVVYQMSGLSNHDSVKTQLNIKAPISAMVWGVIPGAIVGSALRSLKNTNGNYSQPSAHDLINFGVTAVAGVLIGCVVVIAFARKKDAQPFVSVEDFYGGFFVGILAGYNGEPLIGSITKT